MRTAEEKGKRPRTDGAEEDGGEPIDRALLLSIEKLQEIQDQIEKVNEEASDKVLEVEQKYNEIRKPVYVRRNEIIQKIPDFWLTAFLSHPMLGELLTEDDQQIFKHLESLFVDESEDIKSGCSITLTFSSNPYFEDKKLTKTYSMSDDGKTTVKATSIKWKAGMDIVNGKTCTKKGDKRLLVDESFFTWFSDTENNSFAHGDIDQVAEVIKEDLWPNPLKYFNNELEDEFEQEDEEEEGSEEEAEEEDEEDEEET
ncbi:NAP1-related protein 1 [Dichanthelium oligosanthes]|uniref:NAP1-related protein 1 n=1 Tax=Dichanthelium oligosanthes TaxID=888268 RepID=A0A1E5W3I6_9POAL|nr:NAP1-related protein 1 [Dichanthelium oligosanthes]